MRIVPDSSPVDRFLTRNLSGSVFTWREIFELMIPGVLDSLSIMFINMLITALISKNGETSVAAVSLVGPVTALIVNFFNGISAGGTVVVAQCCGRQNTAEKRASIGITLWLTVLIGVAICLPMTLYPSGVIRLLYPQAEPIVAEKASTYLMGCCWSIIVFTIYTAVFAILRGLGYSKRCLVLSIIINVAYFIFSILFLNFLNMDIKGSIYALFLARLLGTICAIAMLFFWRPPEKMRLREIFSFDRRLIRSTLRVGLPLSFEQMFIAFDNIVSGIFVIFFGLHFLGVIKCNIFQGMSKCVTMDHLTFISSLIFGIIFSVGWTPCVGTFLGSALMLASLQGHAMTGMLMLLCYSLGLGIPFILSAVLIQKLKTTFDFIKRNYKVINTVSGIFLILVGIMMATGTLGRLLTVLN